jgi:hypothetical protein
MIKDEYGNDITPLTKVKIYSNKIFFKRIHFFNKKLSAGCLKACISNADNFSVIFPPNCSNEDKA